MGTILGKQFPDFNVLLRSRLATAAIARLESMSKRSLVILVLVITALTLVGRRFVLRHGQQTAGESTILNAVMRAMERHAAQNEGRPPVTWRQLAEIIDLDDLNEQYLPRSQSPIQANYVFITNNLFPPEKWKGRIVLIRKTPVTNLEGDQGDFTYLGPTMYIGFLRIRFKPS